MSLLEEASGTRMYEKKKEKAMQVCGLMTTLDRWTVDTGP